MAPNGSEVYINDERKGSVGGSGRVVLTDVPVGRHVLRVARVGERDDERVIEIRPGGSEQVIQAHLRARHGSQGHPSSSAGSGASGSPSSVMPNIVACINCGSRFAEGVRFCGRCGGGSFSVVHQTNEAANYPCPRCASMLPGNSRFCGRCGLNITPAAHAAATRPATSGFILGSENVPQAERICRRCGGSYPPHIKFCGRCGQTLQQ
jgi:hypothetical protein